MKELTREEKRYVTTSFGDIALLEAGPAEAPPVLFVHGIPTSSLLWRHVIRSLSGELRCLAPDLMGLGDSEVDPERVPLHMEAQAEMLEELMTTLGHQRFALVCHDQGGAAAQLLAARRPERLTCFALTNCVCYDNWPVPEIARLQAFLRLGPAAELLIRAGLFKLTERRTPISTFRRGVFDPARLTDEMIAEYLRPLHGSDRERRRFLAFLAAGSPIYSERAVAGLRRFDRPALVVWAADDRFISPSWGKRLSEEIPGCQGFELVPFCGHFWPEERPAEFVAHLGPFLKNHSRLEGEETPS